MSNEKNEKKEPNGKAGNGETAISTADLKKHFAAYDEAMAKVVALEEKLVGAQALLGTVIETIVTAANGRRKFVHPVNGSKLVARKNRNGEWGFGDPSKQEFLVLK